MHDMAAEAWRPVHRVYTVHHDLAMCLVLCAHSRAGCTKSQGHINLSSSAVTTLGYVEDATQNTLCTYPNRIHHYQLRSHASLFSNDKLLHIQHLRSALSGALAWCKKWQQLQYFMFLRFSFTGMRCKGCNFKTCFLL
jgi:hypothetical protein